MSLIIHYVTLCIINHSPCEPEYVIINNIVIKIIVQ
jgi:hypothetical protein